MKKKQKRHRVKKQAKHLYFYIILTAFSLLVVGMYLKQSASILGVATEEPGKDRGVTMPVQPTTAISTIVPTNPPTGGPEPTAVIRPTDVPPEVIPPIEPTPITPTEPIYVPVEESPSSPTSPETPSNPSQTVDITKDETSVVLENKPTGVETTVQTFMPVAQPVPAITEAVTQQIVTQTPQQASISQPQIYVLDPETPTVTVDPVKTLPIVNSWLALNEISVAPVETGQFEIGRGVVRATVAPLNNQIGVNLSRMELSIKTETGFKPLSYLPDRVVEYLQDSSLISELVQSNDKPSVILEDSSQDLRYQVKGISKQYLFAFIPIGVSKTICVSAQTKDICGIKQSLLSKAIDMMSL